MLKLILIVLQHIIFDVVLPTVDTFSDINFAVSAFSTENYGIGAMILSPVLINLLFNIYLWKSTSFDHANEKRYSWIFVVLNFWPQYQVVKLISWIYTNPENSEWKQLQQKIRMQLSFIEPFVEAVPQYFIALCVYTMILTRNLQSLSLDKFFTEVWTSDDNHEIIKVFGKHTLGISNEIMFPLNVSLSFVGGVKCVNDYLQYGPMSIASKGKFRNASIAIAKCVYVIAEFLNKIVICWATSIIFGRIGGHSIIIVLLIFYILIPASMVIAPIARYLGVKTFVMMYLQNPQLLTLPLITDFVFGPADGYRKLDRCHGCCCSIGCWCWCCCCCNRCQFAKGRDISISKEMSWIKMLYSSIPLAICCIIKAISESANAEYDYLHILIPYWVFVLLGRMTFIFI